MQICKGSETQSSSRFSVSIPRVALTNVVQWFIITKTKLRWTLIENRWNF